MDTFVSDGAGLAGNGQSAGRREDRGHDGPEDPFDDDVPRLLGLLGRLPVAERRRSAQRQAVIVIHLPLVERLATRFTRGEVTRDDLVQAGAIGLILAVDRFDARHGVPFIAYAIPTIVGSMQRHLRDVEPIVKAPRRRNGDTPAEVAVRGAKNLRRTRPVLDAVHVRLLGDWQNLETRPGPRTFFAHTDPALENVTERMMIARHVRSLEPRDRQLIYLRFYEDESLAQIAVQLGLSVSRVSRLLTRALTALRDELEAPEGSR